MRLEGDAWREFFDAFGDSAFRLETLPVYGVASEDDEFRRFLAGEPRPDEELADSPWLHRVRRFTASGRRVERVHVVTPPLSDYLRYEMEWGYDFNIVAGEDVRIIETRDPSELPFAAHQDFWLFDDAHVVLMRYEEDGTQIDRVLLEDADVAEYVARKNAALRLGTPYEQYRARLDT
ncbi:DUF6879 family protein [Nocardiopsis alba]|uniref:DUF6879 family protein n=1 Tax=Nocardiopsis alba TaxID=53437 RepID=UPI0033E54571